MNDTTWARTVLRMRIDNARKAVQEGPNRKLVDAADWAYWAGRMEGWVEMLTEAAEPFADDGGQDG